MMQPAKRPVFLDLRMIHFPVGAVLSILHRVTGVLLVLAIPLFLYLLQLMNSGADAYTAAIEMLRTTAGKLVSCLLAWVLIQHTLSGIRHLAMDLGIGYSKRTARYTAYAVFSASLVLVIVSGWLIWQ